MTPQEPIHRAPVLAYVGLGSNLGDRAGHLGAAAEAMARLPGTGLVALSDTIETAPVGPVAQGPFLNAAAALRTVLPARALLEALLEIERSRGRDRTREQRWGPRTLDLDLLVFGADVIDEPGLTVPHPRLREREFVLRPLAQIAPGLVVPGLGRSARELLAGLGRRGDAPEDLLERTGHAC
jgi:2-amino-4-hydroxy-6-hydroxymethyldihydropteridine diphosphokinase